MHMKNTRGIAAALTLACLLQGCAGINPNNNVGQTTTDFLMQRGDCDGAKNTAEPHALRGEPWAQLRMGLIAMDQRCANKGSEALPWLMKAATFRAETPWEKGRGASIAGESGYFNTRASSTQAALALGNLFAASGFPAMKWYWVQRAASQFAEDEREGDELRNAARELGKAIPVEDQQRISAHWDAKQPWHKQIAAPQTTQGDKP